MRNLLPMPAIPKWLGADNTIDLDALGNSSLETFVDVEALGLSEGTLIYPNWRGCGALGEGHDDVNSEVPFDSKKLTPYGMPVTFTNSELKLLDQGTVFYSFSYQTGTGAERSAESLRRFFYVGKRATWVPLLPVANIRGVHDLHLDPELPEGVEDFTVLIAPYENMRPGDVVELNWVGYKENGSPGKEYKFEITLEEKHLGRILEFSITRATVISIKKGRVELFYKIAYEDSARPVTVSPMQAVKILKPPTDDRLPVIVIPDVTAYLDPGQYLSGLELTIENYPQMIAGDIVIVSAIATRLGVSNIMTIAVDQTVVDRGYFNLFYTYDWLNSNSGQDVIFSYQFSRLGASGASYPLAVNVSKERKLEEYPLVPEATVEVEGVGFITAKRAISGVKVVIPDSVELFGSDKTQVRCNEESEVGYYLSPINEDNPREFMIPTHALAPNVAKSVKVYFHIVVDAASKPLISPFYTLRISELLPGDIALMLCTKPQSSGNLSKSRVEEEEGAEFTQKAWPFFLQGQLVRIVVDAGGKTYYLRGTTEAGEAVSESEVSIGGVVAKLSSGVVQELAVGSKLRVRSHISLDGGLTYIQTTVVELTIVE